MHEIVQQLTENQTIRAFIQCYYSTWRICIGQFIRTCVYVYESTYIYIQGVGEDTQLNVCYILYLTLVLSLLMFLMHSVVYFIQCQKQL